MFDVRIDNEKGDEVKKTIDNSYILTRELIKKSFEESLKENGQQIPENNTKYQSMLHSYFELFSAELILKQLDLSDEELEKGVVGSGNDGGCDALYLFINEELIIEDSLLDKEAFFENIKKNPVIDVYILQSKFSNSFNEEVLNKWKNIIDNLLTIENFNESDFSTRYNNDLISFFKRFHEVSLGLITRSPIVNFKFIYVSLGGERHVNVIQQSQEVEKKLKELYPSKNTKVKVDFIGARDILELYDAPSKSDFVLHTSETPIIVSEEKEYVVLVKLREYFEFITNENDKLIKHIFEANVRDYQGNITVNKEIADSLSDNEAVEDFWWLNNGVTMLASQIDQRSTKIFEIKNPEIVNGLQTSTEIYNYLSSEESPKDDDRNILIRIIVPNNEETRDKIILATNSQTNIPKAILRGTDSIHRDIENYFKTKDLYYDRRKNYYKNEGKPKAKIVSIPFLAQCLISILLKKPNYARARPSTLLNDQNTYSGLYLENGYLDSYYHAAVIGIKVKSHLRVLEKYTTSEQSDISFYVMYTIASKIIGEIDITPKQLSLTDLNHYTEDRIELCAEFVYDKYLEHGGDNKVAKGTGLINAILASDFIKNSF